MQTLHIPHQVDWERLPDGPVPSTASSRRLDALLSKRPDLVDAVKERKLAKCVGGRTGLPGHKSPPFTLKQYAHVIPGMQAEAAARSRP